MEREYGHLSRLLERASTDFVQADALRILSDLRFALKTVAASREDDGDVLAGRQLLNFSNDVESIVVGLLVGERKKLTDEEWTEFVALKNEISVFLQNPT